MIKELSPKFNVDTRQLIASKIVIIFSFGATGFFAIYNFFDNSNSLFYIDTSLFFLLVCMYIMLIKKKYIF